MCRISSMASYTSILGLFLFGASACTRAPRDGSFDCVVDEDCPGVQFCHADRLCYSDFDVVAANLVFVSRSGDDNAGDGSRTRPVRTIAAGIEQAARTSKTGVAIMAGTYEERVVIRDGISLFGGYDAQWTRAASNEVVIVSPEAAPGAEIVECVYAANIHSKTILDSLTIVAGNTTEAPSALGVSVYGIRIVDSIATGDVGLVLRRLNVTAGRASDGDAGAMGAKGGPSVVGIDGDFGGAGGVATCAGELAPVTAGGQGGLGGVDGIEGCSVLASPQAGWGPVASPLCRPGTPGMNYPGCVALTAFVGSTMYNGRTPLFHTCGDNVTQRGLPAPTLTRSSGVVIDRFVAERGAMGGAGQHGGGGPGGGGGGAVDFTAPHYGFTGGPGGGGNSGSCGGEPGMGGGGGGCSIALLVIGSQRLDIDACTFAASQAGMGGAGGGGGEGGDNIFEVADGGAAGTGASTGGNGGGGWRGGPAGGGGGGGSSIGLVLCNSAFVSTSSIATPEVGPAGEGGAGANASPNGPAGVSLAVVEDCEIP